MSPEAPQPTQRRNRREDLLAAAIKVFHEKGYASASIEDVADEVGVLKGSLYHYIDSKEDLLARIFEQSDEQSFALMEEIGALDMPALDRLRAFARAWTLWYLENVERTAVYVNDWTHLTGERRQAVLATRHEYEQRVAEMIEAVKQEGGADAALDTRYATFFVLSAINGLPAWYRRSGGDPPERIADAYAEMIVGLVLGTR